MEGLYMYKTTLMPHMGLRKGKCVLKETHLMDMPEKTIPAMCQPPVLLQKESVECTYIMPMNAKNLPLAILPLGRGGTSWCAMPQREAIAGTILAGGTNAVIFHNHTSGDPSPSDTDICTTKTLIQAFRICGLTLLDHIIIGNTFVPRKNEKIRFYSFRQERKDLWNTDNP